MTKKNFQVTLKANECRIKDKKHEIVGRGTKEIGLCKFVATLATQDLSLNHIENNNEI